MEKYLFHADGEDLDCLQMKRKPHCYWPKGYAAVAVVYDVMDMIPPNRNQQTSPSAADLRKTTLRMNFGQLIT